MARTITVTGDIGRFKMGQKLISDADVIAYHRDMANEGSTTGNTRLSDAAILAIVNSVADDGEEAEFQRMEMIDAGKVPDAAPGGTPVANAGRSISAVTREGEAKALAVRADNDADLSDHLVRVHKSKTWLAYSARVIELDLLRIYGREEMLKWPIIGAVSHLTTDGKVDKTKPTGHPNPDGYLRPTRRKNSSGSAMAYWSDAMAENLKAIRDIRDQLQAIKDGNTLNPLAKEQAENRLGKQVEAMKAKVRAGIRLFQQEERAKAYPACRVVWEMTRENVLNEDGSVKMDPTNPKRAMTRMVEAEAENPISVEDSDPQIKDWRLYSIVQFNNLDFELATANGGTYQNLIDTAKREPAGDDDGFIVESIEDLRKATNVLASFVMDRNNKHAILKELVNMNNDNAEFLVALADLWAFAGPLVNANTKVINETRNRLDGVLAEAKTGTNG